jgi:hypothetical protein
MDALLPAATETIRCAEHARAHDYDPGGTAISAAVLLVAEVQPPWPKPVFDHSALAGIAATTPTPRGDARVLAAVPAPADRPIIRRFDRTPDGTFETSTEIADAAQLGPALHAALAVEEPPADAALMTSPVVLVCTQGTHDVCCGMEGTRLALELAEQAAAEIVRVSHTGGHRFAPTAMTLPDGRMWARLDAPTYASIRDRSVPAAAVAGRCRGWWGAPSGPAQVAERAVFADVGWAWDAMLRRVELEVEDPAGATWRITGDGRTWRVRTEPVRSVPVLSCRAPGGTPVKEAVEYRATIVARP